METDNYQKEIQLYFLRQEVSNIRNQMKKSSTKPSGLIATLSMAACLLIASVWLLYTVDNQYLLNEEIKFGTFRQAESTPFSTQLENAHGFILAQQYTEAITLLEQTPDSDYKDWFLLKSFIGLQKYQLANSYYQKILADHQHIYHSELDFFYRLQFEILRLKE